MTESYGQDTLDLLANVAADFAKPDPGRVRSIRDSGGRLDREMWGRLADNGWLSIMVPEELNGAGLGLDAAALVARRLGYAGFPEPFVAAGVLTPLVLAAAEDDQRVERLEGVMAGETVAAVAWQSPHGGLDPNDAAVSVQSGLLSGAARFVPVADADAYVVAASSAVGLKLYWVPADAAGLAVRIERSADGTAGVRLELEAVRSTPLLDAPAGGAALSQALDAAAVALCAELVGIMDRVLEMTLEFLRRREQFGKPIGSFQALQHRAVDLWIQHELSKAALATAVRTHLDPAATATDRALATSSVKARSSAAARQLTTEALQLHGAIGFTDEYDLGLYLNRVLSLTPWLGGAAAHRRRYAELVDRVASR
jgi:alkylation response protein AidB-like acyl-CoA dehydrogenase